MTNDTLAAVCGYVFSCYEKPDAERIDEQLHQQMPPVGFLYATLDFLRSTNPALPDPLADGKLKAGFLHTPAYNDYLIARWFFFREEADLIELQSRLDSLSAGVAQSALWAIGALRQQYIHFALAWDKLPLHPLEAEYRTGQWEDCALPVIPRKYYSLFTRNGRFTIEPVNEMILGYDVRDDVN